MAFPLAYVAMLLVFLGIDAVWLKWVMKPLFGRHVPHLLAEQMQLGVAVGLYLFYVAGIAYFAVLPAHSWSAALVKGLLLGAIAYGTYEATNMATLKGWRWSMVATDIVWGAALTAATAMVGFFVVRALK